MDLLSTLARALPPAWPDIACGDTALALADAREWRPWAAEAAALLDAQQRARALRQRRAEDRETLTIAYALHRLLLGATLRMPAAAVPLWRDDLGCPRLRDGLAHTSLSHAGAWVAVAIAAGPVGVDVEPAARAPELVEIAAQVWHDSEAGALGALPAAELGPALLALWVRKEAVLKAEGIGLEREMTAFAAADGALLPLTSVPGAQVRVAMVEFAEPCVLALAAPPAGAVRALRLRPPA